MYLIKFRLKTKHEEGNRYPGTERTEGPKQDVPKQTHTKTYHKDQIRNK